MKDAVTGLMFFYIVCFQIFFLAGLPFMNQLMSAAGFDLDEVQLTSIVSPMEYLSFPPVISGTSVGKTTTRRSPKAELVAKDGASALTSHLYRPVVLCTRLVSVTCFEFDLCLSTSTPSRTYTVIGWSFCGKNLKNSLPPHFSRAQGRHFLLQGCQLSFQLLFR